MAHLLRGPRRQTGALLTHGADGVETETPTLRCCHCQRVWAYMPGSGKLRGWCRRCDQPICGAGRCMTRCEPWEYQVELMEAAARGQ